MIKRSTWIVLGVFVILAALTFYWQKSPETFISPTPSPTVYPAFLSGWEGKEIASMEISTLGKISASLKRDDQKRWIFTDASNGQVAQGKVEELLTTLISATIIAEVSPPVNFKDFGLETPQRSIQIQDIEGKSVSIKFGDQTPTGSGYYSQVNENLPVILRNTTAEAIIELASLENLRENLSSEETPMPAPQN